MRYLSKLGVICLALLAFDDSFAASVAGSTATEPADTDSYSVTVPSASSGDEISILVMQDNSGGNIATLSIAASGWTKQEEVNSGGFGRTAALFTKTAGASEPTSVTVASTFSNGIVATAVVVTDTSGLDVSDLSPISTSGTEVDSPGVTVTNDGSLLITAAAASGFVSDPGTLAWTVPPGTTDLNASNSTSTNVKSVEAASLSVDSGSQAALTWTNDATDQHLAAATLVYSPAAGGTAIPTTLRRRRD